MDLSGLDGETCGGVVFSAVFSTSANTTGGTLYIIVCPNDIEANESSTGSVVFPRLCIASFGNGAAADTVTCTWTIARTKTGAVRTFSSFASLASGPTFTVTGVWSDTTTPINMFRVRWTDAIATYDSQDRFRRSLIGGGLSHYAWNALGNP